MPAGCCRPSSPFLRSKAHHPIEFVPRSKPRRHGRDLRVACVAISPSSPAETKRTQIRLVLVAFPRNHRTTMTLHFAERAPDSAVRIVHDPHCIEVACSSIHFLYSMRYFAFSEVVAAAIKCSYSVRWFACSHRVVAVGLQCQLDSDGMLLQLLRDGCVSEPIKPTYRVIVGHPLTSPFAEMRSGHKMQGHPRVALLVGCKTQTVA